MTYEESLSEVQNVSKTWPAAAEAVSRALIDSDFNIESTSDIVRRVLIGLGFKKPSHGSTKLTTR